MLQEGHLKNKLNYMSDNIRLYDFPKIILNIMIIELLKETIYTKLIEKLANPKG